MRCRLLGGHLLWQVLAGGVADAELAGAVVAPAPQGAVGAGGAAVLAAAVMRVQPALAGRWIGRGEVVLVHIPLPSCPERP